MFFASRRSWIEVDERFRSAAELFQRGESRAAWESCREQDGAGGPTEALLSADVLRALGLHEECYREIRAATRRWPEDPRLSLELARLYPQRGRLLAAERQLDELTLLADPAGPVTPALVEATRAAVLGRMGRRQAALLRVERLQGQPDPWVRYELAHTQLELRGWRQALDGLRGVARDCPRWPRPALFVPVCLAALGLPEEAARAAEQAAADFPGEVDLGFAWLVWLHARRDWPRLAEASARLAGTAAPASRAGRGARSLQARALLQAGRREEALEAARQVDPAWAEALERAPRDGARAVVRLQPLIQERDMCVAASLAMVLRHLGRPADPARLYEDMGGAGGVAPWQLDRWVRAQGLVALDVALHAEAVRGLLAQGVPLLATRSRVLLSHMEVLVGYDERLGEVETLDPADGLPGHVPLEQLAATFGAAGEALVAILSPEQAAAVPAAWRDPVADAQRRVLRALYAERIDEARGLLERELASDALAGLRLRVGHTGAFVPPQALRALARAAAEHPQAEPTLLLSAALELFAAGAPEAGEQALDALRARLSPFFRGYLRALRAGLRGDWPRMRRACELLLERGAALAEVWRLLAVALEGCGAFARARRARAVCLEIEPDHAGANLDLLRREPRSLAEREALLRRLLDRHPRAVEVEGLLAQVLLEQGHPAQAERHLRHALAIAPCSPAARAQLRRFFLAQDRADLADAAVPPQPGEVDASDTRTLIARAWDEAAEGPALAALRARRQAGRLRPYEELEVQTLELALLEDWADGEALEALLPARVPAPRAPSLASLLGNLPGERIPPAAARRLRAWAEDLLAGGERTRELDFQLARLDERAGLTARAGRTYTRLAGEGLAEAAYRLAAVALDRHDDADAAGRWLERTLSLHPAHLGAWHGLDVLAQRRGDRVARERALGELVRLRPYEQAYADALLDLRLEHGGAALVRSWLAAHGARYPAHFAQRWRALLHLCQGEPQRALAALGPPLSEQDPRRALALELDALRAAGRLPAERRARIEAGLRRFPADPYLHHLLADSYPEGAPQVLEVYAQSLSRTPLPATAARLVALCPPERLVPRLRAVWRATDPGQRPALAAALHGVLLDADRAPAARTLLEGWLGAPPQPALLRLLAETCLSLGDHQAAWRHAQRLLELDPELPWHVALAARALEPTRPGEARALYQRYGDMTGDPAAGSAQAACAQALGDREGARAAYRASLERRASDPLAVANLHLLGERGPRLLAQCRRALKEPPAGDVQHLAVAAVDLHARAQEPLPAAWEAWAVERARTIQRGGAALRGEAGALRSALHVWCCQRGRITVYERLYGSRRLPPLLALALPWRPLWRARQTWAARLGAQPGPASTGDGASGGRLNEA